jgi:hypothetical protein
MFFKAIFGTVIPALLSPSVAIPGLAILGLAALSKMALDADRGANRRTTLRYDMLLNETRQDTAFWNMVSQNPRIMDLIRNDAAFRFRVVSDATFRDAVRREVEVQTLTVQALPSKALPAPATPPVQTLTVQVPPSTPIADPMIGQDNPKEDILDLLKKMKGRWVVQKEFLDQDVNDNCWKISKKKLQNQRHNVKDKVTGEVTDNVTWSKINPAIGMDSAGYFLERAGNDPRSYRYRYFLEERFDKTITPHVPRGE